MAKSFVAPIHAIAGFAEPLASCSHLAAALVALLLTYPLIRAGRTPAARVGIGVFSLGSVFLFAMSGTYHLLPMQTVARAVLLRLDHAAIWVMIAGTITALQMTSVTGVWRWAMTGVTWAAAITGLVLKTVYFHQFSEGAGLALYLGLGWLGSISFWRLVKLQGFDLAKPILLGGLVYTLGAIIDFAAPAHLVPGIVGPHELFHVAVMAGAALHAFGIHRLAREVHLPELSRAVV
ncbi:MAG: hemolysin III family protein [Sandaracinaceae bacterium]|jgi:hemolysin III|nr:hemolysin III family protein [Sandaracinaceae bacterium]MBP7683626.1 hemolysin III family protein [Deltaproteobacteria bacterium]MBK6813802.1 hemolysin III family protein [Sandaracinaceae bacterium]MBK7154693.1 hemolysin III family protein [Sandaracinaceae bacterium]MBK7776925.1 hemolysin III family protein [Sandaracinaceae bacterium]